MGAASDAIALSPAASFPRAPVRSATCHAPLAKAKPNHTQRTDPDSSSPASAAAPAADAVQNRRNDPGRSLVKAKTAVTKRPPAARWLARRAVTLQSMLLGLRLTSLSELVLDPVAEVGGQVGHPHAVFDRRLASAGASRQQTVGRRHTHLAIAALVAPTESSQDRDFVPNYIVDAREEYFTVGDGEGSAFDLDVNEIGGAQEKRVFPGRPLASDLA